MIRFATFSTHKMGQSQMLDAQRRLFETQMQISSGKVSRSYAGVAIDSRRLVNLENAVTGVQGYIKNIDVIESRLQLMENAVVGAFDVASRFRDLLVNALNVDNASLLTLNQRAEDFLQELTGALNVQQDNRFLFSGARIDTAPIDISVLLSTSVPLVDAVEFTGAATDSGNGITSLTGISGVQVDSGATDDAFQVEFDSGTNTFTVTNLNGGASDTEVISSVPDAGETTDITFSVGGENFVLTIDENFDLGTPITTDTITGNVAGGAGVFGTITLTGTTGDISIIDDNTIETSGTAANATLTLSSSDGDFVATGIDLSADASTVPVTLTNGTTGATITLSVDVTTALDDAAIADADTEVQLNDFLENVAASDGSVNVEDARPDDPGYDSTAPGYYEGDSTDLSVRIDPNATVDYGVTADESGFEKLIHSLYLVLNATVTSGNIDTDTLETALGLAVEAIEEIPDIRSEIGADRLVLETMKVRHQDFIVFTNESVDKIESVDVAAAVARMSIDQVHLEASYMLTARLSQLSLANFLR
jgi:flagellar hook-associated protein 3 FlgL